MVRKRSGVSGLFAELQSLASWVNTSLDSTSDSVDGSSFPSTDASVWENGLLSVTRDEKVALPLGALRRGNSRESPDRFDHLEVRTPKNQSDAIRLVHRTTIQRQAIGMWLSGPSALKLIFHEWANSATSERSFRAMIRARQRFVSFDEESETSVVPEPMRQALGAFMSSLEAPCLQGCFHGWRQYVAERGRRNETTKWLMERLLLSQSRFVLQAVLVSWCHLTMHSRQPTWALALQHDVRTLMRLQHDTPGESSRGRSAPSGKRIRLQLNWSTAIAVLSLACHLVALIAWTQGGDGSMHHVMNPHTLLDSDHDGILDGVDQCPSTPGKHKFRSSWQNDWDGDGCLDSLEDTDDDGDAVGNALDNCPRTPLLDAVDSEGCSLRQRESLESPATLTETVASKVGDAVFEAVVASLFMSALGCAWTKRSEAWVFLTNLYRRFR